MTAHGSYDYVLVGGGLQSALIALAVARLAPRRRVIILERSSTILGNHTWSFHDTDLPAKLAGIFEEVPLYRWAGHDVLFPGFCRTLRGGYNTLSSHRLRQHLLGVSGTHSGLEIRLGCDVRRVEPGIVETADGETFSGTAVIDSRGPRPSASLGPADPVQKFVGIEVRLARPVGLERPILMDATVEQRDGYRFLYVLPFAADVLLIEETHYSRDARLDEDGIETECLRYAERNGWEVAEVLRRERGVLPLPLWTPFDGDTTVLRGGYRGGWFHPNTGYSFPLALRLAHYVASRPPKLLNGPALEQLRRERDRQSRLFCFMNRLLFLGMPEDELWQVFSGFYQALPEATIQRFYGHALEPWDYLRLFVRPPPQRFKALPVLSGELRGRIEGLRRREVPSGCPR